MLTRIVVMMVPRGVRHTGPFSTVQVTLALVQVPEEPGDIARGGLCVHLALRLELVEIRLAWGVERLLAICD